MWDWHFSFHCLFIQGEKDMSNKANRLVVWRNYIEFWPGRGKRAASHPPLIQPCFQPCKTLALPLRFAYATSFKTRAITATTIICSTFHPLLVNFRFHFNFLFSILHFLTILVISCFFHFCFCFLFPLSVSTVYRCPIGFVLACQFSGVIGLFC